MRAPRAVERHSAGGHPCVVSVNLALPRATPTKSGTTGIDKRPTSRAVLVRDPGRRGEAPGSALDGDQVFDHRYHGGTDRAVYAYSREDLDWWQKELQRELTHGMFGENLTTLGVDVNGALIGERWKVGQDVVLCVTGPRIPCVTFAHWMSPERGWLKRFTARGHPGAYLRVERPGYVRAGDPVVVLDRPDHDISVKLAFRALTIERALIPRLLEVKESYLTADIRDYIENWLR